ncbi:hypothetical protein BN946_scf184714.g2 [Trametes cinnabarina]|uniref:GRIP domain-containing protein n=1 Tax=Pycnoporus cinnabarinus TaxID=5643 RepID=A0A060STI6_PYCCI|nr:hypothetical protein BN946_scf184714.g2 [Trametes cinnabarina]
MSSPSLSDVASNDGASSRRSLDGERILGSPPPLNGLTSKSPSNGDVHQDSDDLDPVQRLERELQRTREEKDTLATQYRNLLAKLTTMRTTLGNKLKQDAEELDRQEQLVQQLTAQNEDLTVTVETLKSELIASNEEAERASKELEATRSRALQDTRQRAEAGFEMERERSNNLQSVLEDFQAAKDHDLKQAVKDYEAQLLQVTQSLAEYKSRALNAELQLEESSTNNTRVQELEKEVKEKGFLIGKLRHEAVIMNEHLMEALRRLRRSSTDTNVDRRLVTNVLLSFLTTPRADSKRFEMLSLLATILSWNDDEREKAGLQRNSAVHSSSASSLPSLFGRSSASSPAGKPAELEKTDETESFSRLWVEFLLTQAAAGEGSPPPPKSPRTPSARPNGSLPSTPTQPSSRLSPIGLGGSKRLPSFTAAAMASSPDLQLSSPPRGKGKERAAS